MIAVFIGLFFLSFVVLFQPVLPIALSLALLITGYVCLMVGMDCLKNSSERAVAGTMGWYWHSMGLAGGLSQAWFCTSW